jgi:DNA-binding transcriptional LysR family regulator
MNFTQLATYLEVIQSKSFSKAARKLYLSQPAISLQIKKLEEELGLTLIERDKNSFSVTREGKRFFRFAEYVDQEYRHLTYDLTQMQHGVTGNLNLISSPIIGEFLLPSILSKFKELNPSIEIRMETLSDSHKILDQISNAKKSIVGFCGLAPEDPGTEYFKIGEDEQILIVYPGHPFYNQKEVTIADLMGESLILRSEPVGRRQNYWDSLRKAGLDLDHYQPKLILGTSNGLITAVEDKVGIALISNLAIKKHERMGLIRAVKVKNLEVKRDLLCVYRKEDITDPTAHDFVEFIKGYRMESEE